MLKSHIGNQSNSTVSRLLLPKPLVHGRGNTCHIPGSFSSITKSSSSSASLSFARRKKHVDNPRAGSSRRASKVKAVLGVVVVDKSIKVKATVTVKQTIGALITSLGIERGLDDIKDLLRKGLLLELVSAQLEPKTGLEKPTIKAYAQRVGQTDEDIKYEAEFEVPPDFGKIGAVFVENEHRKEMFVEDIVVDGHPCGQINFACGSWVHSNSDKKQKRVFFANKSYLPSETPDGLKRLREEELVLLRGNGQGERKVGDRIYDYDVYNDLGDHDADPELARPLLGGKERPYPRRCRTGRPRCDSDPSAEKRKSDFYVPRDEAFSEVKQLTFSTKTMYSLFHALIPSLGSVIGDPHVGFSYFKAIDSLFHEGINMPPLSKKGFWNAVLPKLFKAISDGTGDVLRFETPPTVERDKFFWMRDEEFARQALCGVNPCAIQLVTDWPLRSKLDPQLYGPAESAITTEIIEAEIGGIMKLEKAIKHRRIFILDYHDILMPFVSKVREIKGTTLYGSRTLFFLNLDGTLRPLAIELTRPPIHGKHQWKHVYTPSWHSTECWLWRLAKAHVLAHDSGYHQLVSHWLRTHCCTEPYIIATNRQLSAMHPIYRLLHPHFRYTMEVNALAREALINGGGIIESSFSAGKYAMELCSAAYDKLWRFDHQALPQDLLSRGMAIEDLTSPHGLKLTIEDYPFATDGLLLWDAIRQWVTEYINHYYPKPGVVLSDQELQVWWTEIRTVGHGDKKDEPWWPELKTPRDLIDIVTTIVWVASGLHAAVNFGQYAYAGYFPNRPTIARMKMPNEEPSGEEWNFFLDKPEAMLLATFPSKLQATRVMAVLHVLSNHSPDEEYIGENIEPAWADEPAIKVAFEKFSGRLKEIEGIIDERNTNMEHRNRSGAGIVPYQFLKPFSKPGVTGQGVPYSISI